MGSLACASTRIVKGAAGSNARLAALTAAVRPARLCDASRHHQSRDSYESYRTTVRVRPHQERTAGGGPPKPMALRLTLTRSGGLANHAERRWGCKSHGLATFRRLSVARAHGPPGSRSRSRQLRPLPTACRNGAEKGPAAKPLLPLAHARTLCKGQSVKCQAQTNTGNLQSGETYTAARFMEALYQFSRPHTMLGTFISVMSVSLLALQGSPVTSEVVRGMLIALIPALLMNISIVGLNQIYDVEIDKVNKPYLPLASGEFDMPTAVKIVVGTGAVSLVLGFLSGSVPLMYTLAGSLALGIVYSTDLPLLRWKRYPVLAAACVLAVRSVAVQIGFYMHMLLYSSAVATRDLPSLMQGPLGFTVGFMFLFSIVIALFKDLPDTKGDQQANINTLSVRVGVKNVFWVCIALLETAYLAAIAYGTTRPELWSKVLVIFGHGVMGGLLWAKAKAVDVKSNRSITECYMYIWKLFYLEYLFIPLFQ